MTTSNSAKRTVLLIVCVVQLVAAGTLSAQNSPRFHRHLRVTVPRMYGEDVEALQSRLHQLGYTMAGPIDGYYGPQTERAVARLLFLNDTEYQGRVDQAIWDRIFAVGSYPAPGANTAVFEFSDFSVLALGNTVLATVDPDGQRVSDALAHRSCPDCVLRAYAHHRDLGMTPIEVRIVATPPEALAEVPYAVSPFRYVTLPLVESGSVVTGRTTSPFIDEVEQISDLDLPGSAIDSLNSWIQAFASRNPLFTETHGQFQAPEIEDVRSLHLSSDEHLDFVVILQSNYEDRRPIDRDMPGYSAIVKLVSQDGTSHHAAEVESFVFRGDMFNHSDAEPSFLDFADIDGDGISDLFFGFSSVSYWGVTVYLLDEKGNIRDEVTEGFGT